MRRLVGLATLGVTAASAGRSGHGASLRSAQQATEIAPTTIVSASDRLWARTVGVTIVVRDVDRPDEPVSDARVLLHPSGDQTAIPLHAASDVGGTARLVAPDSGEYGVRVLRVGYGPLAFRLRLQQDCQQILEVYITRLATPIVDPVYTAGNEPKRKRSPAHTDGRAVLTTCTPLPNGR